MQDACAGAARGGRGPRWSPPGCPGATPPKARLLVTRCPLWGVLPGRATSRSAVSSPLPRDAQAGLCGSLTRGRPEQAWQAAGWVCRPLREARPSKATVSSCSRDVREGKRQGQSARLPLTQGTLLRKAVGVCVWSKGPGTGAVEERHRVAFGTQDAFWGTFDTRRRLEVSAARASRAPQRAPAA